MVLKNDNHLGILSLSARACIVLGVVLVSGTWFVISYGVFSKNVTPVSVPDAGEYRIEEVATGLEVPWSLAWTSPDRLLVTERPGRVRVIEGGVLRAEPLHVFDEISSTAEEGLMGLAISPSYIEDRYVYVSYAYERNTALFVKVVRMRDEGNRLSTDRVIIDQIPAAPYHAGSRIAFGPDGMLYITTGDAIDRQLAQDLTSFAGKTLRLTPEGAIPPDNPFPDSPVWSYGHRNAQGLTWHPRTGVMYQSEHGPSTFDGPPGGDEVNRILPGGNYGWPLVSHENRHEGTVEPLALFTPAEAPGGLLAYSGHVFPQFEGDLFMSALRGERLLRILLTSDGTGVQRIEEMVSGFGRIRAVAESPDGIIYFTTSNRDGRGTVREGDDRIMRIVPRRKDVLP